MRRQTAQYGIGLLAAAALSVPVWCCCMSGEPDRSAVEAAEVALGDAGHRCCDPRPQAGETSPASPAEPREGDHDCGCGVDLYPGDEGGEAAVAVAPLSPDDVPSLQPVAESGSTPPTTLLAGNARSPGLTGMGTLRARRVLFTI